MSALPARAAVRLLGSCLERPDPDAFAAATAGWLERDWIRLERLTTIHGLAAHLGRQLDRPRFADLLPVSFTTWLVRQDSLNAQRIDRMHSELAAILARAAGAGIEVMPLKGALLTTMPGADPHRRPMGDLDLLVRPGDRDAMSAILVQLGYHREPDDSPRPTHLVFVPADGARVVSRDEHPDNPRRVELHTEVFGHLWGWVPGDGLTGALWERATGTTVLGQPAAAPSPRDLMAHLAIHASSDLLIGRGRLIHWVDMGLLTGAAGSVAGAPHPRICYPALRLTARVMPDALAALDMSAIEAVVPQALARWAARVELDDRCGLMRRPPPGPAWSWRARWQRWAPLRWRLSVAYGDRSLPTALAMHSAMVAAVWRARFSDA